MGSVIQPVLSCDQIAQSGAQYIVGTGDMATFAMGQLRPQDRCRAAFVADNPPRDLVASTTLDMRSFCSRVPRSAVVILATRNPRMLSALVACNQSSILNVKPIYESFYSARRPIDITKKVAVLSTIPRSGTFRLRFFFFALNEVLSGRRAPSAHKLFLYRTANWTNPESPYALSSVFGLLGADMISGHFLPPGALYALSSNKVVAALLKQRNDEFVTACDANISLSASSLPARDLAFEPPLAHNCAAVSRFALIFRDIVEQTISMICVFERSLLQFKSRHTRDWTLLNFVNISLGRFRPLVFFSINGLLPIIFERAVAKEQTVVDVILEEGYLDAMIVDYALLYYAAANFQRFPIDGVVCKIFSYEDMIMNENGFLIDIITFFRGTALARQDCEAVRCARRLTSRDAIARIEEELGHSISHNENVVDIYNPRSHMTSDSHGWTQIHGQVKLKILPLAGLIRSKLDQLLCDFSRASEA